MKLITNGVKNAAFAVVGKAASRAIPNALGLSTSGTLGIAVQAGVAVATAMVAEKALPRGAADFVLAGALMGPIEGILSNVPVIGPALASYPGVMEIGAGRNLNALAGMGVYPGADEGFAGVATAGSYYN